jgi:hypothetical protein
MMSELHWTGAALLLAVAALGGSSARTRHTTEVSWDDFAREHGIGTSEPAASAAAAGTAGGTAPATGRAAVAASAPMPTVGRGAVAATASICPSPPRIGGPGEPCAPGGRSTWLRATATCGHCGRAAGDLEWDAAAPAKRAVLRPPGGAPTHVVPLGARLRCVHCGGPVFADEPERIVVWAPAALAPARRGRLRKARQRAS